MTFIIALISLIIERFFHWRQLRHWTWFLNFQRKLSHSPIRNWPIFPLITLSVVPFCLLVGLVNWMLIGAFYGFLQLIFGIAILMYCLGPVNLWIQVYSCINELYKDDTQTAIEKINSIFEIGHPKDEQSFHLAFTRAIFLAANKRIFAVIFWFVLIGPVGAVLYRSIALMSQESPLGISPAALRILRILDWFPVRLFSFIFALVGSFTSVFVSWRKYFLKGTQANDVLLSDCGLAALHIHSDQAFSGEGVSEKEAVQLLDRAFVMWLVILALAVLII